MFIRRIVENIGVTDSQDGAALVQWLGTLAPVETLVQYSTLRTLGDYGP